jgi:hypothetical protein
VFIGKAILIIIIFLSLNLIDKLFLIASQTYVLVEHLLSKLDNCIRYDVLLKFHGLSWYIMFLT